jgi:ATP phosphoribosyltransferase
MPPTKSSQNRLCLALQKSGRLSSDSLELLGHCGIKVKSRKDRLLVHAENFPLDLLLVRDDDIPRLVLEGGCDLGIVGANVLEEALLEHRQSDRDTDCATLCRLDFGGCRLALALPKDHAYTGPADLAGLRIATSYPQLTGRFLRENGIAAEIVPFSGSVEITPRIGLADAICDLVSTGDTLEANQLRTVETVFQSTAVLIRSGRPLDASNDRALATLLKRIDGVKQAADAKYIMLHVPTSSLPAIRQLLPGCEKPTVLTLDAATGTVAVHAVCRETVFWETLESLKQAGASSILILPIEKMML